ncbi:efflux transporter outer membrane subunit [Pigmentiphaga aceris]|uniref:efflux transporter outer membrane subunit n=1 Tax=Pigmentiphaga aceris TaxID=1940612 RepID=UPI0016523749|nr:efflux transporter outer membrane subunit [Pigmentiphaga aceris]
MSAARLLLASIAAVGLSALGACASVEPVVLPNTVPAVYQQGGAASLSAEPAPDLRSWWQSFHDPVLDGLVSQALEQNLGLAQARSRLRQARQLATRANVGYLPGVSFNTRNAQDASAIDTFFQASLDAVWELGLFGAREATQMQGEGAIAGVLADTQAARVSVVAEVVRNYLDLRAAQQRLDGIDRLRALETRALSLEDVRVRTGQAPASERAQVQSRLAQLDAESAEPRAAIHAAAQGLAVLLGRTAPDAQWFDTASLPQLSTPSLTQVPADLLRTRPEIRKAEAHVLETAGDLGLARSALYPRVVLGASYLYSYNVTQNRPARFNNLPIIGPVIDVPLFDWGRRRSNVDAQQAALDAALLAYREALVVGVGETETALSAFDQQSRRLADRERALSVLDAGVASQRVLQRQGLSSEFDGLSLQRARRQAEMDLTGALASRALAFVALYKALGGAPLPSDADMADVTPVNTNHQLATSQTASAEATP